MVPRTLLVLLLPVNKTHAVLLCTLNTHVYYLLFEHVVYIKHLVAPESVSQLPH